MGYDGAPLMDVIDPGTASQMLQHMERGLYDFEWACGISTELFVIPETRRLPGNNELHVKALVPMSYHIITATGGLRVLLATGPRHTLDVEIISCIMNTLKPGENIEPNIALMRQNAPPAYQSRVEATAEWARASLEEFRTAEQIAMNRLGPVWPGLMQDVAEFQEAIRRMRQGMKGY